MVVVVPPPYQNAVWFSYGNSAIGSTGPIRAFVYSTFTGVFAWVWSNEGNGRAIQLPGWTGIQCPSVVLIGDRLILADAVNGMGGPLRISEFIIGSSATKVQDFLVGTVDDRCPTASVTAAGGVLVATYRHDSSYNLDTAYRSSTGQWSTNFVVLVPGPVGIPSINLESVAGPDGNTWIVMNRDSSHVIDFVRFNEGSFYDFHQALLNADTVCGEYVMGNLAPNGELPVPTVARAGQKVLVCYQNHYQFLLCGDLCSYVVICSLDQDLDPSEFYMYASWVPEVHTTSPIFATASGADFLTWDRHDNCVDGPWYQRRFSDGQLLSPDSPYYPGQQGNIIGWSADGWAVWRWPDNSVRLTKLTLTESGVRLSIRKQGANVIISWTHQRETDVLESSTDLKVWTPVDNATNPMVLPIISGQFFRVRQTF